MQTTFRMKSDQGEKSVTRSWAKLDICKRNVGASRYLGIVWIKAVAQVITNRNGRLARFDVLPDLCVNILCFLYSSDNECNEACFDCLGRIIRPNVIQSINGSMAGMEGA